MNCEVRLLGRFLVKRAGREIPSPAYQGRLVRTLVRVLASRRGAFVSRSFLVDALWPGEAPSDPERNLNVMVARARRALGDASLILTGSGGYCFDPEHRCWIDADEFARRVQEAHGDRRSGGDVRAAYAAALQLWTGEPLAEDADAEWAQEFRLKMFTLRREALERAAEAALGDGDALQAVALAQESALQEPLGESSHLLLARALSESGDIAGALAVIAQFKAALAENLGLDPGPAVEDLEMRLLRGEHSAAASARHELRPGGFEPLAFVGRERELASILGFLGSRQGGVAIVSGASGSGKSRLLGQVESRSDAPVVTVAAFLGERDEPWSLARALVREAVAVVPDAVGAVPERSLPALIEIVPELVDLAAPAALSTDPESRRALAIEAAVALGKSLSERGIPVVVDDLQWADPTSVFLIAQLAHRVPGLSLLLAVRPEEIEPGSAVGRFVQAMRERAHLEVTLAPLSRYAIAGLIQDPELVGVAAEHTDRTPLAIRELIRTLADAGAIALAPDGRWAAPSPEAIELARTEARSGQRRAFVRRTERLEESVRRLIRILALLGRPAASSLLARATGAAEPDVLQHLESLGRLGLVRFTDAGWDVGHALIAESLNESLEPEEKARIHALVAAALVAADGDAREQAHHLAASGDRQAAAESFVRAGTASLDSFATEEAERSADAGLALDPSPSTRSALLEIRAEARMRRGLLKEARADLRAALPAKKSGAERARVLSKLALLISGSEDYFQAGELAELAVAEAGSDLGARARALAVGAMAAGNLHQFDRAQDLGLEALELFRQAEEAEGVADMLELAALHVLGSGHLTNAVEELGKVVALFENSGKLLRVAQPRCLRGMALIMTGRPEEALEEMKLSLDLSRSLGHPEGIALASAGTAIALAALDRAADALRTAQEALATARELHHAELIAISLLGVGLVYESAGHLDAAEEAYRECLAAAQKVPTFLSFAAARLSLRLIAKGDLEGAQTSLAVAIDAGSPFALYEARLAQAELAAARRDPRAPEIAAEALEVAVREGHRLSIPRLSELAQQKVSA